MRTGMGHRVTLGDNCSSASKVSKLRAIIHSLLISLISSLAGYIPSSVMIPQRRFATLLDQARAWQQSQCLYHNAPLDSRTFSLYADHICDRNAFPQVTTAILEVHTDEVWNIAWSHSGNYLASVGRDKTAIIWRVEVSHAFMQAVHQGCFLVTGGPERTIRSTTKIHRLESCRRKSSSGSICSRSVVWLGRWTTQYCSRHLRI